MMSRKIKSKCLNRKKKKTDLTTLVWETDDGEVRPRGGADSNGFRESQKKLSRWLGSSSLSGERQPS